MKEFLKYVGLYTIINTMFGRPFEYSILSAARNYAVRILLKIMR